MTEITRPAGAITEKLPKEERLLWKNITRKTPDPILPEEKDASYTWVHVGSKASEDGIEDIFARYRKRGNLEIIRYHGSSMKELESLLQKKKTEGFYDAAIRPIFTPPLSGKGQTTSYVLFGTKDKTKFAKPVILSPKIRSAS